MRSDRKCNGVLQREKESSQQAESSTPRSIEFESSGGGAPREDSKSKPQASMPLATAHRTVARSLNHTQNDEGRNVERNDTHLRPMSACFRIHLIASSSMPSICLYRITSLTLPFRISLNAIYTLWPAIQLPRTRRTLGCLERDMSRVSRVRRCSAEGGSLSRSSTFTAHG